MKTKLLFAVSLLFFALTLVACSRGNNGDETESNGTETPYNYEVHNGETNNGEVNNGASIVPPTVGGDADMPQEFADTIATAIATANELMLTHSVMGMSVAVVDADTGFTWTQGFGIADTVRGTYVDEHTIMHLGSVAKTFTAVAVMQLVEQGVIDLDTPIVYYLPDFYISPSPTGGDFRNITPSMLLTHTSGILPSFLGYGVMTVDESNPDYINNMLEKLANYFMDAPEDTVFRYANMGYDILGILVAYLTGNDNFFDDFVRYTDENIFARVGMTHSTFALCEELLPYRAMAYIDAERRQFFVHYNGIPTGGVFSSAYDMARFMHIMLGGGGELLTENSVNQMFEVHDFDFSSTFSAVSYGFGIMHLVGTDGASIAGHGGNLIHFHADMSFCLENRIGVFVATNSATGMSAVPVLSHAILGAAVTEKAGAQTLLEPRADAEATQIDAGVERLSNYQGVYIGQMQYFLVQLNDNEELVIILPFSPTLASFLLTPLSDGSFDSGLGRVWFDRVGENDENLVMRLGDLGIFISGIRVNEEYLKPTDDFMAFYGTFMPMSTADNISITTSIRHGVDAFGFAYTQSTTATGLVATLPARADNDQWRTGIKDIEFDEDGMVISFVVMGMQFVRA